jgi:hypothetical protein
MPARQRPRCHRKSHGQRSGVWLGETDYREGGTLLARFSRKSPRNSRPSQGLRFKKRSTVCNRRQPAPRGLPGCDAPGRQGACGRGIRRGRSAAIEFGEEPDPDADQYLFTRNRRGLFGARRAWETQQTVGDPGRPKGEPMGGDKEPGRPGGGLTANVARVSRGAAAKDKEIADLKAANTALSSRVDATVATGRLPRSLLLLTPGRDGRLTATSRGWPCTSWKSSMRRHQGLSRKPEKTFIIPSGESFQVVFGKPPVQVLDFPSWPPTPAPPGKPGGLDAWTWPGRSATRWAEATRPGRSMSFAEAQGKCCANTRGARKIPLLTKTTGGRDNPAGPSSRPDRAENRGRGHSTLRPYCRP